MDHKNEDSKRFCCILMQFVAALYCGMEISSVLNHAEGSSVRVTRQRLTGSDSRSALWNWSHVSFHLRSELWESDPSKRRRRQGDSHHEQETCFLDLHVPLGLQIWSTVVWMLSPPIGGALVSLQWIIMSTIQSIFERRCRSLYMQ